MRCRNVWLGLWVMLMTSAEAAELPGDADVVRDATHGTIRFMRGEDLSAGLVQDSRFRALQAGGDAGAVALAFLQAIRTDLKLSEPGEELRRRPVTTDPQGITHVVFDQVYRGISIMDAQLRVHLNRDHRVIGLEGSYIPTPVGFDPVVKLTDGQAQQRAAAELGMQDCTTCMADLVIWPVPSDGVRLAYDVAVAKSLREKWRILIDAQTGAVLAKMPRTAATLR